jgi:hypothetical protein
VVTMLSWKLAMSALSGISAACPSRPGLRCLELTLALGAAPLVAILFARRWSEVVEPASRGAGIGAAVGLGAVAMTELWCPVPYFPHLLIGHVLPIVVLASAGALIGARLLSPVRAGGSSGRPSRC